MENVCCEPFVSEIQGVTEVGMWNHVASKENPADLLSRGTTPSELENNQLWWHGPSFILERNFDHKKFEYPLEQDIPESKVTVIATNENNTFSVILEKYSDINKLIRVVAYMFRFYRNVKIKRELRLIGSLNPEELDNALFCIIRLVQRESFREGYEMLERKKPIKVKSEI